MECTPSVPFTLERADLKHEPLIKFYIACHGYVIIKTVCDKCGSMVVAKFKISKVLGLSKGASIHEICDKCGKSPISLETA